MRSSGVEVTTSCFCPSFDPFDFNERVILFNFQILYKENFKSSKIKYSEILRCINLYKNVRIANVYQSQLLVLLFINLSFTVS